jgi:hypothetical protein
LLPHLPQPSAIFAPIDALHRRIWLVNPKSSCRAEIRR